MRQICLLAAIALIPTFAAFASTGEAASRSLADEDPFAEEPVQIDPQARRALIVCGLPGDADHRKLFAETVEKIYTGLTARLGCAAERVTVLFSDEAADKHGPALRASRGPATRENLNEVVAEIQNSLKPDDGLWVFVVGHAHFDGRFSWLNLPGPDMNHIEFGKLFAPITCREQVFFITTPVSGFFIKPLAAAGRIVIAATEADAEVNETTFPRKLAIALADPPVMRELDVDADGRSTLLDAYLWSARATAQDYASGELLATEHSLLDDNGDGRGSEVQLDYLTEDLGGRLRAGRKQLVRRAGDGDRARTILLPTPPLEKPEETKGEGTSTP